jgi:hypothetical protein
VPRSPAFVAAPAHRPRTSCCSLVRFHGTYAAPSDCPWTAHSSSSLWNAPCGVEPHVVPSAPPCFNHVADLPRLRRSCCRLAGLPYCTWTDGPPCHRHSRTYWTCSFASRRAAGARWRHVPAALHRRTCVCILEVKSDSYDNNVSCCRCPVGHGAASFHVIGL